MTLCLDVVPFSTLGSGCLYWDLQISKRGVVSAKPTSTDTFASQQRVLRIMLN